MFNFFKKNTRQKDYKEVKKFLVAHFKQLYDAKERIPQDVFDVSSFFITDAIQLFESIDILTRKNHFRGCLPIARTIMEISINFQYVYKKNVEKRAKNFKLNSLYLMRKRGKKITDEASDNPTFYHFMSKLDGELKDFKPEKKSLYKKACELSMESTYESAYRRLSEYTHSGYKPPQDFDENRIYNSYLKRIVFSDTVILILEGLKSMCEKYDLDGGVMIIDEPGYIGTIFYATNPKKAEEEMKKVQDKK